MIICIHIYIYYYIVLDQIDTTLLAAPKKPVSRHPTPEFSSHIYTYIIYIFMQGGSRQLQEVCNHH